jgi:hypothetical protein
MNPPNPPGQGGGRVTGSRGATEVEKFDENIVVSTARIAKHRPHI